MEKVLVQVRVPAINETYDMFIPQTMLAYEVLELMKKVINNLTKGRFEVKETGILCFADSGSIVNINLSVTELGIHNGSKLMLI